MNKRMRAFKSGTVFEGPVNGETVRIDKLVNGLKGDHLTVSWTMPTNMVNDILILRYDGSQSVYQDIANSTQTQTSVSLNPPSGQEKAHLYVQGIDQYSRHFGIWYW